MAENCGVLLNLKCRIGMKKLEARLDCDAFFDSDIVGLNDEAT